MVFSVRLSIALQFSLKKRFIPLNCRACSSKSSVKLSDGVYINEKFYEKDEWTNITPKILEMTKRKLHLQKYHPLLHIKQRMANYMYHRYPNKNSSPLFTLVENIDPVVTVEQNFSSLLVPENHVSRKPGESYYLNKDYMLRAHTSAHQTELINSGFNNFMVVGDVYRRDTVDNCHYPAFHQMEAVRLCDKFELFGGDASSKDLNIFEIGERCAGKQQSHTLEAVKLMEHDLKNCLVGLAETLFDSDDLEYRWVDAYFPFTHPSWELEILYKGNWLEVLGCGVMEQELLNKAGAHDRIGWAAGFGLERLAMKLYGIPDIRLFWSKDSGFLSQFEFEDSNSTITYKPVSVYPQCHNDLAFWISEKFDEKTFHDIVRNIAGDMVEQVSLIDQFNHPKTKETSHCYRIVYRHMERNLIQAEVNEAHERIAEECKNSMNVKIR